MNPPETLSTVAELALGLAGFTGVLVVLGRQPGRFSPAEGLRLAVLLVGSLSALFLSLVPLVLHDFGVSGAHLWRVSSGLMAISVVCSGAFLAKPVARFRVSKSEAYSPWVLGSLTSGAVIILIVQVINLTGLLWPTGPGAYSLGLFFFLAGGVVQFVRILFVRSE